MFFHQGLMACNKIKSLGLFCMQRTFWDIKAFALSRKQENRSHPQCQDFTENLLGLKRPESIMVSGRASFFPFLSLAVPSTHSGERATQSA